MTNEEAFEKFIRGYGFALDNQELEIARETWHAAIAYMQEQNKYAEQSEPVATIHRGIAYWIGKEPPEGTNLFTTPQKQQPLKRLDADKIGFIFRKEMSLFEFYNALMDATEELNHE